MPCDSWVRRMRAKYPFVECNTCMHIEDYPLCPEFPVMMVKDE